MFRPLSDDEKKAALRDGVLATMREAKAHQAELQKLRQTAEAVWVALLRQPTWGIAESPIPSETTPQAEGWNVSVTPKVVEQ